MKNRTRLAWLFAMIAVISLMASACGSSDSAGSSSDPTTTAAGGSDQTTAPVDTSAMADLSGTLNGRGSSFQDTFEQAVASDFEKSVKEAGGSASVTYTKSGSSDGKKSLGDETVQFAGSDSPIKDEEKASFGDRDILYFPIVGGPIAVAYNLKGRRPAQPEARHHRQDLPSGDHHLGRRSHQGRQPRCHPPVRADHRGASLRRLRHHQQLHQVPEGRRSGRLEARCR